MRYLILDVVLDRKYGHLKLSEATVKDLKISKIRGVLEILNNEKSYCYEFEFKGKRYKLHSDSYKDYENFLTADILNNLGD